MGWDKVYTLEELKEFTNKQKKQKKVETTQQTTTVQKEQVQLTLETAQVNAFLSYMASRIQAKGNSMTLEDLENLLVETAADVKELKDLKNSK